MWRCGCGRMQRETVAHPGAKLVTSSVRRPQSFGLGQRRLSAALILAADKFSGHTFPKWPVESGASFVDRGTDSRLQILEEQEKKTSLSGTI